ncbi:MAG: hypothetical protein U9O97_02825, partial [Elusimicrobiota bacterium]|nr:hypothetical protein [Elusimicrobiota bacterium]
MRNKRFAVFAFAGFFLMSCSALPRPKKVWSSKRRKPKWISVIPEKAGYYYYLGISQNQEDKGIALQKALEEGMKQVLSTIGIVVGTKMRLNKEISGNKEITKMVDKYRETGKAKLRGQKVKEMYTEEYL